MTFVAILLFSNFRSQISFKIKNPTFKITILPNFPILTILPCQKWSISCQNHTKSDPFLVKSDPKPVKTRPLFDKNYQKSPKIPPQITQNIFFFSAQFTRKKTSLLTTNYLVIL